MDQINERLKAISADKGKPCTCPGKGCCACCSEPVYSFQAEVQYILDRISPEARERARERVPALLEKFQASPLFQMEEPPVMDYLALRLPCPFLEKGECSIYEHRSYACRCHMAIDHPDLCSQDRLRQRYIKSTKALELGFISLVEVHQELDRPMLGDHFLVLLANELLDDPAKSGSRLKIEFTSQRTLPHAASSSDTCDPPPLPASAGPCHGESACDLPAIPKP